MPQELLSLSTLHEVEDGELATEFDGLLRNLVRDCLAKPGVKKARKLVVTLEIWPVLASDGTCDQIDIVPVVKATVPNRSLAAHRMSTTRNGGARFMPSNPMDPDIEGPSE